MTAADAEQVGAAPAGSVCPACGRPVDPLRAGQVSIVDGVFVYLCNEACKRALHASRGAPPSEVETASPPSVAPAVAPGQAIAKAPASSDRPPASDGLPDAPVPLPLSEAESPAGEPESSRVDERRVSIPTTLAALGLALGFLAPCLELLGGSTEARLLLASAAVLCCFGRAATSRDVPVSPLAALAALGTLWGTALYAWRHGDPRAQSLADLAGLAAAAHLASLALVDGPHGSLRAARLRILRRLDVPVRVVHPDGTESTAGVSDVKPGEDVVVSAGETLGVDGRVIGGQATVRPWLDGPLDVLKKEGDAVVAGAVVLSGKLRVVTSFSGNDRAYCKVATHGAVESPLVRRLGRVVRQGPAAALVLAAALSMVNGAGWVGILAAGAIAVLALASGAVLGIVAVQQGHGVTSALGHGITYRDAAAFDRAGHVEVVVVCGRGTVLMGAPEIVAIEEVLPATRSSVVQLAAGASVASAHPSGAALRDAAVARGVRAESVRNPTFHPGLGVTALTSSGQRLVVGNRALLLQEKVSVALFDSRVTQLEAEGRSVILVGLGGKLVGLIALQDGLRPGVRGAVQRLLDARLEPVLLSGEARDTCETIGRALDVEHIRPEVLPDDRGEEVRSLAHGGRVVAVIGAPGADDAALGAAEVAVALRAAGSGSGDWTIALASDDVPEAARALTLAIETRKRAQLSILVGLLPGVVAAGAIALGVVPLWVGPLAIVGGVVGAVVQARR